MKIEEFDAFLDKRSYFIFSPHNFNTLLPRVTLTILRIENWNSFSHGLCYESIYIQSGGKLKSQDCRNVSKIDETVTRSFNFRAPWHVEKAG